MASLSVAAIVVSHSRADLLAKALEAVSQQTQVIDQVVVVETAGDEACIALAKSFGFSVLSPGNQKLGAAIQSGINALSRTPGWIWVLHDDAVPEPRALQFLAQAAEVSPSVAIIGPKLLELDNPIEIQQLGLTATPTGRPFLLVQREYDQGQHDNSGDTLAVSTAGMLVSLGVWQQLGGLDDESPVLGQDLEFGAKARVSGYRVIVEPRARIHHAGLSMKNQRPKSWLSGSSLQAASRAHLHFATLYLPAIWVLALYVLMPLIVLLAIPVNLANKRPMRSISQFAGWIWAWFTFPKRLAARSRFRSLGNTSVIKPLLATKQQRRKRRKNQFELASEVEQDEKRPGFFSSNAGWFTLIPLIVSFQLFPAGAITANGMLPIGNSLSEVFATMGISVLPFLDGSELPADPFGWWALLAAALWPANPSLALATMVFLSPTIAYLGAWQFVKQFVAKAWLVTLTALVFALSPQLLQLKSGVWVMELLAAMVMPWALLFSYRAFSTYASARAWRWVGLAGLSLSLVAAASPMTFAILGAVVLTLSILRPKRGAILIWILLPGVLIIWPQIDLVLAGAPWQLLTSAGVFSQPPIDILSLTNLVVFGAAGSFALVSWFVAPTKQVFGLWSLTIGAMAICFVQPLASSSVPLLVALLAILVLAALTIEGITNRLLIGFTAVSLTAAVGFSIFSFGIVSQSDPGFTTPRTLPALVGAASQQNNQVRTLVITPGEPILVDYLWGSGLKLEQNSLAYQLQRKSEPLDRDLALIAANLVAGNQEKLEPLLAIVQVDFVLLAESNAEYKVGLDSLSNLQAAGSTSYGDLYKVLASSQRAVANSRNEFRDLQLAALLAFALLAVPTKSSILGRRRKRVRAK